MAHDPAVSPGDGADSVARVDGVVQRYGTVVALNRVSLALPAGRAVALIGPDGVGKSTLLGLIAGVRRVQQGRVATLGGTMSNARHRAAVCPRIAFMPQGLGQNLYGELSVRENIEFFGRLFDVAPDELARQLAVLLESTGLSAFADRPAGKLSGGMKQKLGLCCALIHSPDLLILDEPTTGVDPLSRRHFWALIDTMREARPQLSVIAATAYMEEAERFDWLVMMDSGRVLAEGTPAALKTQTRTITLDDAYAALLPAEKRGEHRGFTLLPLSEGPGEVAIEAHALTRLFGDFVAVDHVDFSIRRGEIFGFLGPNGCGKTTTMKILTGLLPASTGEVQLFGIAATGADLSLRKRIGYMSQSFSLYEELTVRRNLELHAHLFDIPAKEIAERLSAAAEQFGLGSVMDSRARQLPLGVKQRLSLAVATIHHPEILILDEPTSGVDPVARDHFWALIQDLSRRDGVTVFVSTHYMTEAMRCDRVSFMSAGRVLACGTPQELMTARSAVTLEDAFISYIGADGSADVVGQPPASNRAGAATAEVPFRRRRFALSRLRVLAWRETVELLRDRFRLASSFIVPLIMMLVFGFGISADIENLPFAVFDQDRTPESRTYLEHLSGSRYFTEMPAADSEADLERRFQNGEIKVGIEIPPGFGRDLTRLNSPAIGVWLDGTKPFIAETARGYLDALHLSYLSDLAERSFGQSPEDLLPAKLVTRFWYNQSLESRYSFVPGLIAVVLLIVPAMYTAVAVVREKELGSITNLYATPVTRLEFLLGKQLPYAAIGFLNFLVLTLCTVVVFGVPMKGSMATLAAGAVFFVLASTGIGLVMSSFTRTQAASLIGTLLVTLIPGFLYSGLLTPVASLGTAAEAIARVFPTMYFYNVSVGVFTKDLGVDALLPDFIAMALFFIAAVAISTGLLRKQAA